MKSLSQEELKNKLNKAKDELSHWQSRVKQIEGALALIDEENTEQTTELHPVPSISQENLKYLKKGRDDKAYGRYLLFRKMSKHMDEYDFCKKIKTLGDDINPKALQVYLYRHGAQKKEDGKWKFS